MSVEWGVLWGETGEVEPTASQYAADALVDRYPVWDGVVVRRIVTYSAWREPPPCNALWAHCKFGCIRPCDHEPCPHHEVAE